MYSGFNGEFMIMIDFLGQSYCIHMVFIEYSGLIKLSNVNINTRLNVGAVLC